MKGNIGRRVGPAPPILAVVALLLTLGVVATAPLAYARYVAAATFEASARVAKWQPEFRYGYRNTGTVEGSVDGGGFVMHPGSWRVEGTGGGAGLVENVFLIYWSFYNYGEVGVDFWYKLMSNPHTGGSDYAVGDYVHTTPTELTKDNFGAYNRTSGSQFAVGTFNPAYVHTPGANYKADGTTPEFYGKYRTPPSGNHINMHLFLTGYRYVPARPDGSEGGTAAITKAAPIRFGKGEFTMPNVKDSYWRSFRINIELVAEQAD